MNPKSQKSVCRYNRFWYCKFSDKCHNRHNDVLCSGKNCDVFNWEKRYPKICNYNRDFGICKFTTYYRYNHEKQIDVKENSEQIMSIENKLQEVEEKKLVKNKWKNWSYWEKKILILRKILMMKNILPTK